MISFKSLAISLVGGEQSRWIFQFFLFPSLKTRHQFDLGTAGSVMLSAPRVEGAPIDWKRDFSSFR